MKTIIIKTDPEKTPPKKLITTCAKCVEKKGLVVFPTETVYGIACAVAKESLNRLDKLKGRPKEKRYTLHIGSREKVFEYVPKISLPARKLISQLWPGPLTIVFELSDSEINSQKEKFGPDICNVLYRDNTIGIRCPDQKFAKAFLDECIAPVVAPSANLSGLPPAANPKQAREQLDGLVDIIVDAGQCRFKKASTVVKLAANKIEILRQGIYSEKQITEKMTLKILFVCTGNSCRSPMAEGFAKKTIAEKIQCDVDLLPKMGYKISSAGIAAATGMNASPEAIRYCGEKGVDISKHKSRMINIEMVQKNDFIFVMSQNHLNSIIERCPEAAEKCVLLDPAGDILDPIGGGIEAYKISGAAIKNAVNKKISELII